MEKEIRDYCLLLYSFYHEDQSQLSHQLDEWLTAQGYTRLSNKEIWKASEKDLSSRQQEYQELRNKLAPEVFQALDQILKDLGIDKNKSVNYIKSSSRSSSSGSLPKKAPKEFTTQNQDVLRSIKSTSSSSYSSSSHATPMSTFYQQKVKPVVQKAGQKIKTYRFKPIHLLFYGIVIVVIAGLVILRHYTSPYYKARVQLGIMTTNIKNKKFLGIQASIREFETEHIAHLKKREQFKLMTELSNKLHEHPNTYYALYYMDDQDTMNYPQFRKYYMTFLEQFPDTNTPTHAKYKQLNDRWEKHYNDKIHFQEEESWYQKLNDIQEAGTMKLELTQFKERFPESRYIAALEQKLKDLEYEAAEELQNETD